MKTVLVTGSTGFVGRVICSILKDSGYKLITPTRANVGDYVAVKNWDKIVDKADIIVHLGALAHRDSSKIDNNEYIKSNTIVTNNLMTAAINQNVKKFVFISTSKVYGERSNIAFIEEDSLNPHDIYAKSKVEAENLLMSAKNINTQLFILRIPLTYGPNVKANFKKLLALARAPLGIDYSIFSNKKSYLSVYNLASAVEFFVKNDFAENKNVFNVTDKNPYSVHEIISEYRKVKGLGKMKSIRLKKSTVKNICDIFKKKDQFNKLNDQFLLDNQKLKAYGWEPSYDLTSTFQLMKNKDLL